MSESFCRPQWASPGKGNWRNLHRQETVNTGSCLIAKPRSGAFCLAQQLIEQAQAKIDFLAAYMQ